MVLNVSRINLYALMDYVLLSFDITYGSYAYNCFGGVLFHK